MMAAAPETFVRSMMAAMTDAQVLVLNNMQQYPPQRAAMVGTAYNPVRFSTRGGRNADFIARNRNWRGYRRTFTLRLSWHKPPLRRLGNRVVGEVVSAGHEAPYNIYVQKHDSQASIHRGVWETEYQVVQRLESQVTRIFREALDDAVARLGR
jgi:hypothetical protein